MAYAFNIFTSKLSPIRSLSALDTRYVNITGDQIKPTANSTTTFGVQQADGTQVFNVDTSNAVVQTVKMDTRANILALTATAGGIAYATDTERFYVADGSDWRSSTVPFGKPSAGVDIGAFKFDDDRGYGEYIISNKELHNITIGVFSGQGRLGSIRANVAEQSLEIYTDSEWKKLRALSDSEISEIALWSVDWTAVDQYNNLYIHGMKMDIGVFASEHQIEGGTF